jgi:hypothetical protein
VQHDFATHVSQAFAFAPGVHCCDPPDDDEDDDEEVPFAPKPEAPPPPKPPPSGGLLPPSAPSFVPAPLPSTLDVHAAASTAATIPIAIFEFT